MAAPAQSQNRTLSSQPLLAAAVLLIVDYDPQCRCQPQPLLHHYRYCQPAIGELLLVRRLLLLLLLLLSLPDNLTCYLDDFLISFQEIYKHSLTC